MTFLKAHRNRYNIISIFEKNHFHEKIDQLKRKKIPHHQIIKTSNKI